MADKSTDLRDMIRRTYHGESQLDDSCQQDTLDKFAATHERYQEKMVDMGYLMKEDKHGLRQVPLKSGRFDLDQAYKRACHPSPRDTVFLSIQHLKEDQ